MPSRTLIRNSLVAVAVSSCAALPSAVLGDWFKIPGFTRQDTVIIDEVTEKEDWISLTFWTMEEDGFVSFKSLGSRKSADGEASQVVRVPPVERSGIIAEWRGRGFTARVTSLGRRSVELSNVFLNYEPPAGYRWSAPAYLRETSVSIKTATKVRVVHFREISLLSKKGTELRIVLENGQNLVGEHSPPTFNSKPYRPSIYGIQYGEGGTVTKSELPFDDLESIKFIRPGA